MVLKREYLHLVLTFLFLQERKLKDEINQLKKDLEEQDAYVFGRKNEAAALENLVSGYREVYSQYKAERDKLHTERKYDLFLFVRLIW